MPFCTIIFLERYQSKQRKRPHLLFCNPGRMRFNRLILITQQCVNALQSPHVIYFHKLVNYTMWNALMLFSSVSKKLNIGTILGEPVDPPLVVWRHPWELNSLVISALFMSPYSWSFLFNRAITFYKVPYPSTIVELSQKCCHKSLWEMVIAMGPVSGTEHWLLLHFPLAAVSMEVYRLLLL